VLAESSIYTAKGQSLRKAGVLFCLHWHNRWGLREFQKGMRVPRGLRRLEAASGTLERLLGRKTMEIEILREALAKSESKKPSLRLLS
jgi:hypothetical protein